MREVSGSAVESPDDERRETVDGQRVSLNRSRRSLSDLVGFKPQKSSRVSLTVPASRTMFSLGLVLLICSTVWSESVRETETWMPVKATQTAAMLTHRDTVEASGSDFRFTDEENEGRHYAVLPYDDEDEYDEFSGSGDGATTLSPRGGSRTSAKPDINDNKIPGVGHPARPTVDEEAIARNSNEIPLLRNDPGEEQLTNVLMSHASDNSIFNKTGVLAALITGCALSLIFAVFLILLLIHRMKKKDEGSYDLGKKPIYKKAPTTEIYA